MTLYVKMIGNVRFPTLTLKALSDQVSTRYPVFSAKVTCAFLAYTKLSNFTSHFWSSSFLMRLKGYYWKGSCKTGIAIFEWRAAWMTLTVPLIMFFNWPHWAWPTGRSWCTDDLELPDFKFYSTNLFFILFSHNHTVNPLITNTSKEFIKCRILQFLLQKFWFLIKWLYGTL